MNTELATVQQHPRAALALNDDQSWWDNRQLAALRQMGVDKASDADLLVFLHVAQKTGLDPFARQIYMIGRNVKDGDRWVTKQTIQTGIDGFRLIARRAADRAGETLEYDDTQWADGDGNWTDVWTRQSPPAAAKVTIYRDGKKFSAVAAFREYVQTNRNGDPNPMWARMPANQLAKCAEALALRKAFPQDLSGIYTDDEMGQADRPGARQVPSADQGNAAARMAAVLDGPAEPQDPTPENPILDVEPEPDAEDAAPAGAEDSPRLDMRSSLAKALFAVMGEAGIPEDGHHKYLSKVLGREITSRKDLTEADARIVIDATRDALDNPFPDRSQS